MIFVGGAFSRELYEVAAKIPSHNLLLFIGHAKHQLLIFTVTGGLKSALPLLSRIIALFLLTVLVEKFTL